jgi:hypothetical protein
MVSIIASVVEPRLMWPETSAGAQGCAVKTARMVCALARISPCQSCHAGGRARYIAEHRLDHAVDQVFLVADMVVERIASTPRSPARARIESLSIPLRSARRMAAATILSRVRLGRGVSAGMGGSVQLTWLLRRF